MRDDGDFTDPASRAPWARGASSGAPDAAPGAVARAGSSIRLVMVLGLLGYLAHDLGWFQALRERFAPGRPAVAERVPAKPRPAAPSPAVPPSQARAAVVDCAVANSLHEAAEGGCEGLLVALLARRDVAPDARDAQGRSALAAAVLAGRHESARLLLRGGANVNAPILWPRGQAPRVGGAEIAARPELADGSTPLIVARDAAMVRLLLAHRADLKPKNRYGWSAAFHYTHHGSPEMLDLLLSAGARVDDTADVDPSHAGSTPLMWAAFMGRTDMLRVILAHRPDLGIRDRAGKTALDYARQRGHPEAARTLMAAGAT